MCIGRKKTSKETLFDLDNLRRAGSCKLPENRTAIEHFKFGSIQPMFISVDVTGFEPATPCLRNMEVGSRNAFRFSPGPSRCPKLSVTSPQMFKAIGKPN